MKSAFEKPKVLDASRDIGVKSELIKKVVNWVESLDPKDKVKVASTFVGTSYLAAGFLSYFVPNDLQEKMYQEMGLSNWTSVAASSAPVVIGTAMSILGGIALDKFGLKERYSESLNRLTTTMAVAMAVGYQFVAETDISGGMLGVADQTDLIVGIGAIVPAGVIATFWKKQTELHGDEFDAEMRRVFVSVREGVNATMADLREMSQAKVADISRLDAQDCRKLCGFDGTVLNTMVQ
jgi:hypothetical protein